MEPNEHHPVGPPRRRIHRATAAGVLAALAAACSSPDTGRGASGPRPQTAAPITVTGTVTYDFVPAVYSPETDTGGLAFDQATQRPVRNAFVQVQQNGAVVATTVTDGAGNYAVTFDAAAGGDVLVVAGAVTDSPRIQIEDNTDGEAIWAVGRVLSPGATTLNLHAAHGWTGAGFDPQLRAAAPFAILDSMYTAAQAFRAVREVAFPDLKVNWSPDNAPQLGDPRVGQIGGTHFDRGDGEIYVLGLEGADTDEFDAHVIVHEWAHYLEANLGRTDSPGGPHALGDVLDPRLSFGEGYGNALASMVLPASVYVDTQWAALGEQSAFGFDLETEPTPTNDPDPGVFSEQSVGRVLYDLFDAGPDEAHDTVALGLGPIFDVLVGPQRTTTALTTIASFVTGLKAQPGVDAAAVDAVLARHGMGPMTSDFGDGDARMRAQFEVIASVPFESVLTLLGGFRFNTWQQNQFYVLTGNGAPVRVSARSDADVAIIAYRSGVFAEGADDLVAGTESFTLPTTAGTPYVLVVTGLEELPGEYQVVITVTSP